MTNFRIQFRVQGRADGSRLAKEFDHSARENVGKGSIEKASSEIPGLVLARSGRQLTFTYHGVSSTYFLRYDEPAAILTGTSHPMSYGRQVPLIVQRHIDATLERYWHKLNEQRAAS